MPVLVLVFNNPQTTERVVRALAQVRPTRLYLAADGPREGFANEIELCELARKKSLSEISWKCKVSKRFLSRNEGVKRGVKSSIDWFFSHEPYGIVLEHDCVPSLEFFKFVALMLDRYKNDARVFAISGSNMGFSPRNVTQSHFFSKYIFGWGWASWASRWRMVDAEIQDWKDFSNSAFLENFFGNKRIATYWKAIGDKVFNDKLDVLDFQMNLTSWRRNALCAVPSRNLVVNIGFSANANNTYSASSWIAHLPFDYLPQYATNPEIIVADTSADNWYSRFVFESNSSPWRRFLKSIAKKIDPKFKLRRWLVKHDLDWFVKKSKPSSL